MKTAVTMKSNDHYRSTVNRNETVLTALNVQQHGIKHLFDCMLPGDHRGSENQPLIVPDLMMDDGDTHDVMFIATMHNDAYAFDANDPDPETGLGRVLWQQTIGHPVNSDLAHDMHGVTDHWGTTATGAIDLATQTWYLVVMTSPDGSFTKATYRLHALDLISGDERCPALDLSDATYVPPDGLPKLRNGDTLRKQRSALLFDSRAGHDTVFLGDSTFGMMTDTAHGFIIAVDVTGIRTGNPQMTVAATLTTTSHYPGAGIWMSSQGFSMDDAGYLYAATANGAFDGKYDFADSIVKMRYTPPSANGDGKLEYVDWWAGYTDAFRQSGQWWYPYTGLIGKMADPNNPSAGLKAGNIPFSLEYGTGPFDSDLGSAGAYILPKSQSGLSRDLVLACGKDGLLFVADPNNLGKTVLADFAPDRIKANWAKLLCPPFGATYYPGDMDLTPVDVSTLKTTRYGFMHHNNGPIIAYKSSYHGLMLLLWGQNGPLRAIGLSEDADGKFALKYLGQGQEIASANLADKPPGGMPGGMISLTCNGHTKDTAVIWASVPWGDANHLASPGRLVAYCPEWIKDGSIVKIWDSRDWGIGFLHCKFNTITVANGKLYLCTYDGRVMVFGLA